jgi:hypothetical protein
MPYIQIVTDLGLAEHHDLVKQREGRATHV